MEDQEKVVTLLAEAHRSDISESIAREVFEDVMGDEPQGSIDVAVNGMDDVEQAEWARELAGRLTFHRAETGRMIADQGLVDKDTLNTLGESDRGRVAYLRMTTRPWAVRWMVRGLLAPFAIIAVDVIFFSFNVILRALFGLDWNPYDMSTGVSAKIFEYEQIVKFYTWYAGWASLVVMSYFGLREFGKSKGHDDVAKSAVADAGQAASSAMAVAGRAVAEVRERLGA
jgi:hypothetical protein